VSSSATNGPLESSGHRSANEAEALVESIATRVVALLAERPAQDDLLDAKGAAKLPAVPESWVRSEARAERIP
jgi:hypothetical protein